MSKLYGFVRLRQVEVPELRSVAELWQHEKTKAQVLSLINADDNKTFAVAFRTLPNDNTGVAHILEHAVLNGSRKYPVKEPFVELMKSSLNTFLNAFTYPDKTIYPFASQNTQDFYNLLDVYLDAVFFPLLSEQSFLQEGWHYSPTGKGFQYKGVVFNEMKGAQMAPDRNLWQSTQESLFPETIYRFDSGGIPSAIVDLQHSEFVEFHRRFYHPSNALFWFAGNDDPKERLRRLAEYLDQFSSPTQSPVTVPIQNPFMNTNRLLGKYPSDSVDNNQAFVTRNWVVTDDSDLETQLKLSTLQYLLIGTSTAPLRKALIDSGLGEDLAGDGLELDLRQKTFSIGLRGCKAVHAKKIWALITKTLEKLKADGFEHEAIVAALNTMEFSLRENNSGSFPQGLSLGLRVLRSWVYGTDPISILSFEQPLADLRSSLLAEPNQLQQWLELYFLENTHGSEVLVKPDKELLKKIEREEQKRLKQFTRSCSAAKRGLLEKTAAELKLAQETPDSPEVLQTLPVVALSDIPSQTPVIPTQQQDLEGVSGYVHELDTNGVVYLDIAWSIAEVPEKLRSFMPLLSTAFTELGTQHFPEESLQTAIDTHTGGISTHLFAGTVVGKAAPIQQFVIRVKSLPHQIPQMVELLIELLTATNWSNERRLQQLILEEKAQFEASLTEIGNQLVSYRLNSRLTSAGMLSEEWNGITQLELLRQLSQQKDSVKSSVGEQLKQAAKETFLGRNCQWNLTVSPENTNDVLAQLRQLFRTIGKQTSSDVPKPVILTPQNKLTVEALVMPSTVNFVGVATKLPIKHSVLSGVTLVVSQLLRTEYLWNKVRVQGGAYGANVRFELVSGVVAAVSYRDPRVKETIGVFKGMSEYLRTVTLDKNNLEKVIIGTIGELDRYQLPDAKGYKAFVQEMIGLTKDLRQQIRDEVLGTTVAQLNQLGSQLSELSGQFLEIVMCDKSRLPELQTTGKANDVVLTYLQQTKK